MSGSGTVAKGAPLSLRATLGGQSGDIDSFMAVCSILGECGEEQEEHDGKNSSKIMDNIM